MKIELSLPPSQLPPKEPATVRSEGATFKGNDPLPGLTAGSPATVSHGDATHLSYGAVLAAASSSMPEVRSDKVSSIRQTLASGTYAVRASDVAAKLIDHMLGY